MIFMGFSSSFSANSTYGTSAHLIISRTIGIIGSLCISPRTAESPTLVLVVTGFYRNHQKNVQDRRKDGCSAPIQPLVKLCKVWAWWSAWSSRPGLKRPGSSASSTTSSGYVSPSSSLMPPTAMIIPCFMSFLVLEQKRHKVLRNLHYVDRFCHQLGIVP